MRHLSGIRISCGFLFLAGLLRGQFGDFTQPTPLLAAVWAGDTAKVRELLRNGVNPNEGPAGYPAVIPSLWMQNREMFRAFVEAGVDLKVRDGSGATTLMWAAYNDDGSTGMVEEILKAGVDVNAKDNNGETALLWALRRGHTPVVRLLRQAGASRDALIRQSVEKALALLLTSSPQFVKVSGCVSCHHQNLPAMAASLARERGFAVSRTHVEQNLKMVMAMWRPLGPHMAPGTTKIPNPPIVVSYSLVGLAADNYPADTTTQAMVRLISGYQRPDGSWPTLMRRPPIEASDFTATALSLRSLQLYGGDPRRIERAREWLLKQAPQNGEDRAMQLLGLAWAKADAAVVRERARALLADQRSTGGWAQIGPLDPDAYATGQALVALHTAGVLRPSDDAYDRGVDFLLRTQLTDGSWLVRTRSFPIQPYKESGFPHGKDQWISAAGTGWASMALTLTVEPRPASTTAAAVR